MDKDVKVIFDHAMDVSKIPNLVQTTGTHVNYVFVGLFSTYRQNDTAVWSHENWSEDEDIGLMVENYTDNEGDTGYQYLWSFHTGKLYDAYISPESLGGVGLPGTTVEYTLTIHNTGLTNDTYNLSISGNSWNTELYDSNGNAIDSIFVPANSSAIIRVNVTIPSDASEYVNDTVYVGFSSQNRSSVTGYSSVKTTTPFETPWFDDMDGGNRGWKSTGLWEKGMPTSGPNSAFSSPNCWATNLDGDYGNNVIYTLTSPYYYINNSEAVLYRNVVFHGILLGWRRN